jgi:hypothetical protein
VSREGGSSLISASQGLRKKQDKSRKPEKKIE